MFFNSKPIVLVPILLAEVLAAPSLSRRDGPGGHAADGPMKGHDMGPSSGGGGMGMSLPDLSNPAISSVIQSMLKYGAGILPVMPLNKTEDLPPNQAGEGVKRKRFYWGPLRIESMAYKLKNKNWMGLDPQGTSFYNQAANFPTDITILRAKTATTDGEGKQTSVADGLYTHHIVLADASKYPPAPFACPGKAAGASMPLSIFTAAGQEVTDYKYTATGNGELKTGFFIPKDDRIFLTVEMVNYTNDTKTVWAYLDLEYLPGKVGLDTSSEAVSVTQCDGSGIGIKPPKGQKQFATKSKEMTIEYDGYLFGIRGHLHDGGDKLTVAVNGKIACSSNAVYEGKKNGEAWDTMKEMSTCADPIKVKKGDKLLVETFYDLGSHPPRNFASGEESEEMGIANMQFARSN